MAERVVASGQAQPMVRATAPEIVIHGRHLTVSDRLRALVEQRLDRVERFGIDIMRIDVEITHHANPRMADRAFTAELTCRVVGPVIRAEAHASEPSAAVDLAAEHLSQRLARAAQRRNDRHRGRGRTPVVMTMDEAQVYEPTSQVRASKPDESVEDDESSDVVYEQGPIIVREKRHVAAAMDLAEALEAMESVGHDFYLFQDSASGMPSVVYRRTGWQYGLIRLVSNDS